MLIVGFFCGIELTKDLNNNGITFSDPKKKSNTSKTRYYVKLRFCFLSES